MDVIRRSTTGRWVPAIPCKAPIDVRWSCSHAWALHVHDDGSVSHLDFDCIHCGATTETAGWPMNGPYRIRGWIARKLWGRGFDGL